MTALSDRIAAEHTLYSCTEDGGTGVYGQPVEVYVGVECECGWTTKDSAATSQHLAAVTERAVRDAIAQQLMEAESSVFYPTHSHPHTLAGRFYMEGVAAGIQTATLLAREGTTP